MSIAIQMKPVLVKTVLRYRIQLELSLSLFSVSIPLKFGKEHEADSVMIVLAIHPQYVETRKEQHSSHQ
jgi:hypothetical protein